MARRYFNWKLMIVSLMALAILGSAAYVLRRWQRSRRAEQGLTLGTKAYEEKEWGQAARQLGRYLAVVQNDVPALLKYAEAQLNIRPLRQNNIEQAVAAYRNVLRLDHDNLEAAKQLSEIYLNMSMPGEAGLIITRLPQTEQSPEMRRILAIALANQRKFDEAANELKIIIETNPEQISTYETLGWLAEQQPEHFSETADFWFEQAVEKNQSSAAAYIARGAYLLRQAKQDKALADLKKAEQMDLSDVAVRLRLAEELVNADAIGPAEAHLEIVQAGEPENQLLWQTWAKLALKSDSNDTMLNVAENGLKELSTQPWDFMPYAVELFIESGRLKQAEKYLTMMRQKDIAPPTAAFLEGLLAEKQGNSREAVKHWQRAVQLGAKSAKVRMALADALWRIGNKQTAVKQLRNLILEQPNLFNARFVLAQMLAQMGQWDEAVKQTLAAKQIAPDSIEADLLDARIKLQMFAYNEEDKDSMLYREMEITLNNLEKAAGDSLDVKLLKFRLAILQKDLPEAEKLLADLSKAYPAEAKVILAQAELYVNQNKADDAITLLREAHGKFPHSQAILRYLVSLLSAKDRQQDCVVLLENAFESETQPLAKRDLGLLLSDVYYNIKAEQKRYLLLKSLADELQDDILVWRAVLTCRKVLDDPGYAQQVIDRIKSIEGQDGCLWRYEQARLWFERADFRTRYPEVVSLLQENLLDNPDDQASRMLLAAAHEKEGNYRLAISAYTEALSRSPSDVRIMVPTVVALYRGGEYNRAEEILNRAAKEKLYHPQLELLGIRGAMQRGDTDSANDALEQMLLRDPNNRSLLLSLALLKIKKDRFEEAEEIVEELKAQEPNSLSIAAVQVDLNIQKGNYDEALRLCNAIVSELNSVSAYLLRARTYAVLGRISPAKKDFERAVNMEPDNENAWVEKINFYRSIGESDEAITNARRVLSVMPENLRVQKTVIAVYLDSGLNDLQRQGEKLLKKAIISNPGDVELLLRQAQLLLAKGTAPQIDKALDILQSITENQPEVTEAWVLLARIALQQGKPARAIDVTLRGLVHRPNDKSLLMLKAKAEATRSPELALPTMRALWEVEPDNAEVAVSLAEAYMDAGYYADAVKLLEKLPPPPSSFLQRNIKLVLAEALYKKGKKAEAEKMLRELSGSEPNDPSSFLVQAKLMMEDKLWKQLKEKAVTWCDKHPSQTQDIVLIANELISSRDKEGKLIAEELLRCALKHNENTPAAMMQLAVLLQTTNRSAEAVPLYKKVIESQPQNLVAVNNLAWILCEEQGRPQDALELAQRGMAASSDEYVDLIDTCGMAYYRLGRYKEAAEDFKKCLRLYPAWEPDTVFSYFHLGRCLAGLGEKTQAIQQLNRALELNKEFDVLSGVEIKEANELLTKLSSGEN